MYYKIRIKPGYENSTLHDEIIFKIWNELQVWPELDTKTGKLGTEDYIDEYIDERLVKYYGSESSVDCHRTIISKSYPDYFYSLDEAKAQTEGSYMLALNACVKNEENDIRASLINIASLVEAAFIQKYSLDPNYYEN